MNLISKNGARQTNTQPAIKTGGAIAVERVDAEQPLPTLSESEHFTAYWLYVTLGNQLLGKAEIHNQYQPISQLRLCDALCELLAKRTELLAADLEPERLAQWASRQIESIAKQPIQPLPVTQAVSIVVATFDRPERLRKCLHHLTAIQSPRKVEIVVVDNHPASGLTAPIVAEFPGVVLVQEPRQGLAYARNAGFLAASGEIAVATDDDVTVPPDWLEKLLPPFADPKVMVVTGNTLPIELQTAPQQIFEAYGGLGRGFETKRVGTEWFRSFRWSGVTTWHLGATANAAFRTAIFDHPQIGLMDEALGPGMPSGVGEDTYLYYKVLNAGFDIVYVPNAYVWHEHRRDMAALRRQLYDYSKGHSAYHLTTLLRDNDWRGLWHLIFYLPLGRTMQFLGLWLKQFLGIGTYPLSLFFLELRGNLAGPWALWQSRRRVEREGRSRPVISK